ncbi:MAG: copper-binding protein [Rubrivivax sp.]|nr:copper-binding protein [Rubrivivax sp.]
MKTLVTFLVLASTLAPPAVAQPKADDHAAHQSAAAAKATGMTDGEIRKVDKGARKLTIKHGEIKNLDMPPMTMVFQVKDGAMLDKLKVGDRILFAVEQATAGLVVTDIRPAP